MRITTLCYIENGDSTLMLYRNKKENDENAGKWIGVGGHTEEGESPEDCLIREVREETGLSLSSYRFRGIITFVTDKWDTEYMCLYTAKTDSRDITECTEGELRWVKTSELSSLPMWEGDRIFFDLIEKDSPFFSLKLCYHGNTLIESSVSFSEGAVKKVQNRRFRHLRRTKVRRRA